MLFSHSLCWDIDKNLYESNRLYCNFKSMRLHLCNKKKKKQEKKNFGLRTILSKKNKNKNVMIKYYLLMKYYVLNYL